MWEKAVLDRLEDGGAAVLLVGDEERELLLAADQLPAGAVPGVWLLIELRGDCVVKIKVDEEATASARERISAKMQRLRERGPRL